VIKHRHVFRLCKFLTLYHLQYCIEEHGNEKYRSPYCAVSVYFTGCSSSVQERPRAPSLHLAAAGRDSPREHGPLRTVATVNSNVAISPFRATVLIKLDLNFQSLGKVLETSPSARLPLDAKQAIQCILAHSESSSAFRPRGTRSKDSSALKVGTRRSVESSQATFLGGLKNSPPPLPSLSTFQSLLDSLASLQRTSQATRHRVNLALLLSFGPLC
jgi:hypothetical protein